MNSDELQRLKERIEQVNGFIAGLEKELQAKPDDFSANRSRRSMRNHLEDLEQQRAELEAKQADSPQCAGCLSSAK